MLFSEGAYHIPQQEREKERMEERDSVSAREASLRIMREGGIAISQAWQIGS